MRLNREDHFDDELDRVVRDLTMIPSDDRREIRRDVVARVRWEIEQGIYDTADKLECTLEQLLDDLDDG